MVDAVRTAQTALGSAVWQCSQSEKASTAFRRSLFAVADIARGETLTAGNIRSIRPGCGIAPRFLPEVLNRSVNQTLSRTLLTSLTTLGTVLALLFVGGEVIRPFALAMAIGVVVGTYSSIFIAAPLLLYLEQRFGEGEASGGSAHPKAGDRSRRGKGGDRAAAARP